MNTTNTSIFSSITSTYRFSDTSDSPLTNAVSAIFQFYKSLLKEIPQNPEEVFSSAQTALRAKIILSTLFYKISEKIQAATWCWVQTAQVQLPDSHWRYEIFLIALRDSTGSWCPKTSRLGVAGLLTSVSIKSNEYLWQRFISVSITNAQTKLHSNSGKTVKTEMKIQSVLMRSLTNITTLPLTKGKKQTQTKQQPKPKTMPGFNQLPFGRRTIAIHTFQYSGFTFNLNTNSWRVSFGE